MQSLLSHTARKAQVEKSEQPDREDLTLEVLGFRGWCSAVYGKPELDPSQLIIERQ